MYLRILKDITGIRSGKLVVVKCVGKDNYGNLWECLCDCGKTKIVRTNDITFKRVVSCGCEQHKRNVSIGDKFGFLTITKLPEGSLRNNKVTCVCECGLYGEYYLNNLRRGTTTSCGCKRSFYAKKARNCHGESTSVLYKKWASMKNRCQNKNAKNYNDYGGRGIRICNEWLEFWSFREWAYKNGYCEGLSIERINVNGNYEPSNCKWVMLEEQARNKRRSVIIEYGGKKQTAAEWARELGIGKETITYRHRAGWSDEECLFGKESGAPRLRPRMEIPDYLKSND